MQRTIGTVSRGVRAPIIRQGDDIAQIVIDSVLDAVKAENIALHDRDVIAVTEAVVARAQGNYASIDDIAADVHQKYGSNTIGLIFPILSRNRFSVCLSGIAKGAALGGSKIVLMFSYPSDEVGNPLVSLDALDEKGIYLGGSILAGVRVSTDALFRQAAMLPRIELIRPASVLGQNTIAQIQAGSVMGYIGAIEYLIRHTKAEMGYGDGVKVVATGGLARLIADNTDLIDVVDSQLIVDGLRIIYERYQKQRGK